MDNDVEYIEQTTDIYREVFDKDFDEVGWNPEPIDDSDEEAAEMFAY